MARTFALIASGMVVNTIEATSWPEGIDITDLSPRPGVGWIHVGGLSFNPPAADPSPPEPPPTTKVTRLAFRQRLTDQTLVAIEIASIDNPAATQAQRQFAAQLRVMAENVRIATYIDLARADTRAGVQALEAAGLIAPGRAAQILDAPVLPAEAWRGA